MSCLGPNYNPNPPRLWSRVENNCIFQNGNDYDPNELIYVPVLKRYVTAGSIDFQLAVLRKGNILQYKKNSSNITKNQRYAQIARGNWTNRTTTWATQTETYTNPNTNMLQRINYSSINSDGTSTLDPITRCPLLPPKKAFSFMPPSSDMGFDSGITLPDEKKAPILPPPPPADQNQNISVLIPPPLPPTIPEAVAIIVIPDGGTLICNTTENICTGEVVVKISPTLCVPTSASDVPGPLMGLCYDDSLPTYYPKTTRTYASSNYVSKSDIEPDYSMYRDIFNDFLEFARVINELLLDFSATACGCCEKLAQLYDRLTPTLYNNIESQLNNLKNNLSANDLSNTSIFLNNILDILFNAFKNLYVYKNSTCGNNNTNCTDVQAELDNVIAILKRADSREITDLIEKYLWEGSSCPTGGFIPPATIPAAEISIDKEYIEYIKKYGYPPTGIFIKEKLDEIRSALNADKAFIVYEDTEVEITKGMITKYLTDISINYIMLTPLQKNNGILKIGATSQTAILCDISTNYIVDISHNVYWTPKLNYNGLDYAVEAFNVITNNDTTKPKTIWFVVRPVNDAPTLTTFTISLSETDLEFTTDEDTEIKITYDMIKRHTDVNDVDANDNNPITNGGIISAFIIRNITSGTLKIDDASMNKVDYSFIHNTIDPSHNVYWKPDLNTTGTLDAFTLVARDNLRLTSVIPVQIKVIVTPINDAPTLTAFTSVVGRTNKNTVIEVTFDMLTQYGNEYDVDGQVVAFTVKEITSGTLKLGTSLAESIPFDVNTNNTITSNIKAYWTPALDVYGTKNAFSVIVKDNDGLISSLDTQVQVYVLHCA